MMAHEDTRKEKLSKRHAAASNASNKRSRNDSSDEDDDASGDSESEEENKPAPKKGYKLSPALSELMGETEMPRHEVVKRVWTIIKEKNLYDPNNKQFAICDDALYKVIGTKRFRTFGMMKYLKTHFLDD
ncbi:unnamed protein product [Danaus chrysippus]|uniref:(African queen) hypothetical protein n=1 Tax=Danaus chrysippus TaxID=151541 RepID=A0A8J2W478_9NEOP|nr:unnamed protein product [Danaus chrysippus]